jgi:hypothetical protein
VLLTLHSADVIILVFTYKLFEEGAEYSAAVFVHLVLLRANMTVSDSEEPKL